MTLIAGIDAGNSKIEALLVEASGRVVARAQGGAFRPQIDGVPVAMAALAETMQTLLTGVAEPVALIAAYLAGADSPDEERLLGKEIAARGWGERVVVGNDTQALLRCGAPDGWGVAVVCGAGINAIGVAPDGRPARFPALGELTGDWGGGGSLSTSAVWHAVRGEDGRGPTTALSSVAAAHFGRPSATDVGIAAARGEITYGDLLTFTPTLFAVAADGDPVAAGVIDRLAAEVATMAAALLRRLDLLELPAPVVLGGGVLRAGHTELIADIGARLNEVAPAARCVVPDVTPVVGAALLGLDDVGAGPGAADRLLEHVRPAAP